MLFDLSGKLYEELRSAVAPGRRLADALECVASVLLAIMLAHLIGAQMVAWAAFTAFVLMKGPIVETIVRAVLRMIGTLVGAALALGFERLSSGALWQTMIATALIGGIGLYGMLTARRAYAWLLFGLTFIMIVLGRLEHPALEVGPLALTRVLEVGAGTLACLIVSLISTLTARRWWPVSIIASAPPVGWHPDAARHALQAALALGLLPVVHRYWGVSELAQAGVTIMAVMIVPVAGLGASALKPVGGRLRQRALGCLCGGTLAAAVLFFSGGSVPLLIAGTCVGIIIGRLIENGSARNAYVGLQFTLAILVVLVPDNYANASIEPGLMRLTSVFVGMGVLLPVLLVGHLVMRREGEAVSSDSAQLSE
jgi:uncharacterized membrane protein YccC